MAVSPNSTPEMTVIGADRHEEPAQALRGPAVRRYELEARHDAEHEDLRLGDAVEPRTDAAGRGPRGEQEQQESEEAGPPDPMLAALGLLVGRDAEAVPADDERTVGALDVFELALDARDGLAPG